MKRQRNRGLLDYLEKIGVLEHGSDEDIRIAKRTYRKQYLLSFKRAQRKQKPEYTINFSKETGEYDRIALAAKRHKMTISGFIHASALAYINNTYVVPDRMQVAHLEQLLADCLNEIKTICGTKEKYFWQRDEKMEKIEKRIEKLEAQIDAVFRNPPTQQIEN